MTAIRSISRTCVSSLQQAASHSPPRITVSVKTHAVGALILGKETVRLHSSKPSSTRGKEPWIFIPNGIRKLGIGREDPLILDQASPASKQLNLNKLGDAGGSQNSEVSDDAQNQFSIHVGYSYQPEILDRNQRLQSFTPEKMDEAAREGRLEEKIHDYLTSVGNNPELSEGLKKQKRYWVPPLQMPLHLLQPCTGPEKHMEFPQPPVEWDTRIANMVADLLKKWAPPPLLCEYREKGVLSIRDGSHRFEALKQVGHKKYWVIVWCNTLEGYETFNRSLDVRGKP